MRIKGIFPVLVGCPKNRPSNNPGLPRLNTPEVGVPSDRIRRSGLVNATGTCGSAYGTVLKNAYSNGVFLIASLLLCGSFMLRMNLKLIKIFNLLT
jgi:hypothetical protein